MGWSLKELIFKCARAFSDQHGQLFLMILWSIWKSHNVKLWENKKVRPQGRYHAWQMRFWIVGERQISTLSMPMLGRKQEMIMFGELLRQADSSVIWTLHCMQIMGVWGWECAFEMIEGSLFGLERTSRSFYLFPTRLKQWRYWRQLNG